MAFTFSKHVLADVLSWACTGSIILVWYVCVPVTILGGCAISSRGFMPRAYNFSNWNREVERSIGYIHKTVVYS